MQCQAYFADCFSEFEIVLVGNSDISQNGDDAIELFEQGVVIETFGELDVDGTGQPSTWIHGRIKLMVHGLTVL